MIWFEQTCCYHLPREKERGLGEEPWQAAPGGQAGALPQQMPLGLWPEDDPGNGQFSWLLLSDLFT